MGSRRNKFYATTCHGPNAPVHMPRINYLPPVRQSTADFGRNFPFSVSGKKGPDRFDPGRTALRDGYLSVMAFDFDPPSTGELEKTVTEVGLLVHTVVSVGSEGPPGLNTWS